MTDIARRTYPRNDIGPRAVDSRVNRIPDSSHRRRREGPSVSFSLAPIGPRLPSRIQTNTRIGLKLVMSTRNASQLRHVNPQGLVAVASLVDGRTGAALPGGYLLPGSNSVHSRLVQHVGSAYEVKFEDLVVKQPGAYQFKVTVLRMPEASATGGEATHIAQWESDSVRVQAMVNGA